MGRMRRIRFHNQLKWIGASSLALLIIHSAVASVPNLRPEWSHSSQITEVPNCSFLNDQNHSEPTVFLNRLVDQKTVSNLNQQYQDMNRDYEMRVQYGLADRTEVQSHGDDVSHFGRQAFAQVRHYQVNQEARHLKTAVDRDETLKALLKPAAVVGAGAAFYSGTPVSVNIDDDTTFRAMANVPTQTGQVSLLSTVGTTSVDFDMNRPDPNKAFTGDPRAQIEKYRFSFSRGLPLWDLTSGLSYGGSTTAVGASLSKSLMPHLTAVVDSVRPMQQGRYYAEESLRFFYGLSF